MVTSVCLRFSVLLITILHLPHNEGYGPIQKGSAPKRTTTPFPPGVQPGNVDYNPESNSIAPETVQPTSGSYNHKDSTGSYSGSFSSSASGKPDYWWANKGQTPFSGPVENPCTKNPAACSGKPAPSPQSAYGSLSSGNTRPENPTAVAIQPDNPWLSGIIQQNSVPSASSPKPVSCGYGGCSKPSSSAGHSPVPSQSSPSSQSCGYGGCSKPSSSAGHSPVPSPSSPSSQSCGYGGCTKNQASPTIPCTGAGYVCVSKYLCRNGVVVQDGSGLFNLRTSPQKCDANTQACCHLPKPIEDNEPYPSAQPAIYSKPSHTPGQNGIPIGGSIYDLTTDGKPLKTYDRSQTSAQTPTPTFVAGVPPTTFAQEPNYTFGSPPSNTLGPQPTPFDQKPGNVFISPPTPSSQGSSYSYGAQSSFSSQSSSSGQIPTSGFGSQSTSGFASQSVAGAQGSTSSYGSQSTSGFAAQSLAGAQAPNSGYGSQSTSGFAAQSLAGAQAPNSGYGSQSTSAVQRPVSGYGQAVSSFASQSTSSAQRPASGVQTATSSFAAVSSSSNQRPTSGYGSQASRPSSGYGAQSSSSGQQSLSGYGQQTSSSVQRPTSGYGPRPTSSAQRPSAGYGGTQSQQNIFGSGSAQPPDFQRPNVLSDVPRPTQSFVTQAPFSPYTGPLNTTPHPGCAAALKCVQEIFCTADGVMSDNPVYLTPEEAENRVPLSECQDIETGIIGKCCRDPNYTDPWPAGMMMNKQHDDGQYHEDNSPQGTTPDICGPTATCTAAYECSADRQVQPVKGCRVPLDGSTGVCCSPSSRFPQGSNNLQINTSPSNLYPSTSPLTPTQQYYTPKPPVSNNPFLPENEGRFPIPEEPIRKPFPTFSSSQTKPFPQNPPSNQIPVSDDKNYDQYGKQSTPVPSYRPSKPQSGYPQPTRRPQPGYPQPKPTRPQISNPEPSPSIIQSSYPRPSPSRPQPGYPQPRPIQTTPETPKTTLLATVSSPPAFVPEYQTTAKSETSYGVLPTYSQKKPEPEKSVTQSQPKPTQPKPEPNYIQAQSSTPKPEIIYTPQPLPIETNSYPGTEDHDNQPDTQDVVEIPQSKPTKTRPKGPPPGYPNLGRKTTPPPLVRPQAAPEEEPGKECGVRRQVPRPNGPAGLETGFGEFPWQAQVLSSSNQSAICGGAILSETVVVTAAHCVDDFTSKDLLVKAGDWKLVTENPAEEPKPVQIRYVAAISRHPKYDAVSRFNDMAVLVLEQPLKLDSHVDVLCLGDLAAPGQKPKGKNCVVTGWGKGVLQANLPGSVMHSIPVNFIESEQCENALRKTYLGKYFQLHKSFTCALPTNPNYDLCQVDVGSPIACQKPDGRYELSGVFSWDVGCHPNTNVPAAASSVDVKWVQSVIEKPVEQLKQEEEAEEIRKHTLGRDPNDSDDTKPGFSQGYGK